MTENKFTDEEIIRSLELCFTEKGTTYTCAICPYHKFGKLCKVERDRDALAFINRQQAEIKKRDADIEGLLFAIQSLSGHLSSAKAEAIKEFAERVKRYFNPDISYDIRLHIDTLVKEMTEGQK